MSRDELLTALKREIGAVLFDKYGVILSPDTGLVAQAAISAIEQAGMAVVPVEPPRGLLVSMALRSKHDFLMAPQQLYSFTIGGTKPEHRENVLSSMRQLHEEVVGTGFWSPDRDAGYVESFDRAMIEAGRIK